MSSTDQTETLTEVAVVIGSGPIGQAIVRRVGVGRTILLADINSDSAESTAHLLGTAGYTVQPAHVDVSSSHHSRTGTQTQTTSRSEPRS
jgi:threonine dehydrogenase-like Zn-dependent dehydrogenase